MKPDPCSVCGGTDLNLIDGFYYCVECGTQDVNAQETIVEHTVLGDGTFAHATSRKITVLKDAIEMSGEWHKWHAFNFILLGLVEEVMALGASAPFRERVLWIWTRYMKMFMVKHQMGTLSEVKHKGDKEHKSILFDYEDEDDSTVSLIQEGNKNNEKQDSHGIKHAKKPKTDKRYNIKMITKGLLLSIIYIALNQDESDIQLSHLLNFINEGRISLRNCLKFVPKEIDVISIPHWKSFLKFNKNYDSSYIRQMAFTLIKVLELGSIREPDYRKIVNNIVKELCLPQEFKDLVFSLMHKVPCDFVKLGFNVKYQVRVPDYEGMIMSYVLVALKMCFGLDDEYEILLSETVDNINITNNHLKSYKLGMYSEPSDRLFSFREWSNFLQYRETLLCKYYLPMAQQCGLDIDDQVFMAHLGERPKKKKVQLSDEVTMDIIDKVAPLDEGHVIPRSEFVASLTALTHHTEVILQFIQDPEIKLLLSEDFSQYSLKYACKDLKLQSNGENIIKGISIENKIKNDAFKKSFNSKRNDQTMVFVRNCENRNWLKTKPPTVEHITDISEKTCDKDSEHGYESNLDTSAVKSQSSTTINEIEQEPKILETIEEEKEGISIFDDEFKNINYLEDDKDEIDVLHENNSLEFNNSGVNLNNTQNDETVSKCLYDETSFPIAKFNPESFDRDQIIKELILEACKRYKIPIPKEYNPKEPVKRKVHIKESVIENKKRKIENKTKRGDSQKEVDRILTAYYTNMEEDLLNKVSEHIKSFSKDFIDLANNETAINMNFVYEDDEINNENKDINVTSNDGIVGTSIESDSANKIAESSIIDSQYEDVKLEDLLPKIDPKFDEKTHDTKQLYIRLRDRIQFEDILEVDNPTIERILEKKIEECRFDDSVTKLKDSQQDLEKETLDSESLTERGLILEDNEDADSKSEIEEDLNTEVVSEPLVENKEEINEFKYWEKHYLNLAQNRDYKQKFDIILKENFPKSFIFVITQCAAVLNCSTCSLYRHLQMLEQRLFNCKRPIDDRRAQNTSVNNKNRKVNTQKRIVNSSNRKKYSSDALKWIYASCSSDETSDESSD